MKKILVVLYVFCLSSALYGQDLEISGYFEPQYAATVLNSEYLQLSSNKLRIDFSSEANEKIRFGGNVNYITYHGRKQWDLLDFFPDNVTRSISASMRPYYSMTYEDRMYLDNAWVKISLKCGDMTIGKQQISIGTGYTWNPTDVFNYKNIIDPTYEQPGHNAVRMDIPLGLNGNLYLLVSPEDSWKHSTKMFRLKSRLNRFDVSLTAIDMGWKLNRYTDFNEEILQRRLIGGDITGELFGLGVWGEFARNILTERDDFTESVIGVDYTFDSGLYGMAEYYRNSLYQTDYKQYSINDWMRTISGEYKATSRDNLFTFISYPATDLLTLGNILIVSMNDHSFVLAPTVTYSAFENADITIIGNFNFGKEGKSYSESLGYGGIFRLRYYF